MKILSASFLFCVIMLSLTMLSSIPKKEPLKHTPIPKKAPSKLVKKQFSNNYLFSTTGMEWIQKAECGPIPFPCCHEDKNDSGGFTCMGIAIKWNTKFYSDIIKDYATKCTPIGYSTGQGTWAGVQNRVTCKYDIFKERLRKYYIDNYAKRFLDTCPFSAALQLIDAQILSGKAVQLLQKSHGLIVDGLYGKESIKACNNFNPEKFRQERRLKMLKLGGKCKTYCSGWFKRIENLKSFLNEI